MSQLDALIDRKMAPPPASDLPSPEERRRLREAMGLTQAEVAEALGVKRVSVTAWENGRWEPRAETRVQYAYLLREIKRRLGEEDAES